MVHHSIAVVITSFLTNFSEFHKSEVQLRRIRLLRTRVNRGRCLETVSKVALEDLTLAPPTRGSGHAAQLSQRRCPSTLS
jgi:hypothetical protein